MKARAYAGWAAGGLLLAALVAALAGALSAQSATYGGVSFPIGDRAFADRVVEYIAGSCVRDAFDDPEEALGPPDAKRDGCQGCGGCDANAVSLGFRLSELDTRGHLVLEFVDNVLLDGPGNDLFVYITNDRPCQVEISADGSQYISVGVTVGYPGAIDIGPYVTAGAEFRFVRLSDVPADEDHSSCPGASIDAVGAMGPAEAIAIGEASGSLEVQPVGQLALALQGGDAESLLIILDCSSSMAEVVQGEVKIDVAKEVILDLLSDLPASFEVGLRVFADCESSQLLVPIQPLVDVGAFRSQVTTLTPHGLTPIAYTLQRVKRDFAGIAGAKLVLLITDGMETCDGDPVKAAKDLLTAGYDLRVNVVGYDIGRDSEARDQLTQIAQASGGVFLEASNRDELRQALSLSAPFSYSVYDSSGSLVYSGRLGEATGPQLPAGTYRVVIGTRPPIVLENVVVSSQQTTIITVEQQNGSYTTGIGG
jgi:Mg-chelatase subunit ChlD